jgi:hypothetical protein
VARQVTASKYMPALRKDYNYKGDYYCDYYDHYLFLYIVVVTAT